MNRRDFLKNSALGSASLLGGSLLNNSNQNAVETTAANAAIEASKTKNWVWVTPDRKASKDEWKKRFDQMKAIGIDAILPEVYMGRKALWESDFLPVEEAYLEKLIPIAHEAGLEIHAWMWTMPCLDEDIQKKHPDWFNSNGHGQSCLTHPAYVDYYKFLDPAHPEVQEFIQRRVKELAALDVDGVHFDYVRYPDSIIAEALQPKYNIVQDRVYPEYDYGYSKLSRAKFEAITGIDPLKLDDPEKSSSWFQFRCDQVTHLVNTKLIPAAKAEGKKTSAAVFPNWVSVRQQWSHWKLDYALPMLYQNFYNEGIRWIREKTKEEVEAFLFADTQLYSGLYVPSLTPNQLALAFKESLKGGAKGISLFDYNSVSKAHWDALEKAIKG